jgi:NAD-dependent dihydropyrimidine dehydrogenase PreA subunit
MMKYLSRDLSLKLDINACIGCGMCETVCPHGVFAVENQMARILDREACIECGACALNCPAEAIAVASGVGCAEAIMNGLIFGKETCCANGECCCASSPASSRASQDEARDHVEPGAGA